MFLSGTFGVLVGVLSTLLAPDITGLFALLIGIFQLTASLLLMFSPSVRAYFLQ
jgi:hypothetical protein